VLRTACTRADAMLWKTCGRSVHFLWTRGGAKFFSERDARARLDAPPVDALSSVASLVSRLPVRRIPLSRRNPKTNTERLTRAVKQQAVHHFNELINGHPYLIEVSPVAQDRWRAYIVRIPGVPTALMPFYGATPAQAAEQLRAWLTQAHERASGVARV
jgi:hypothetical protein